MSQTRTYRGEYRFVPDTEVNAIIEYSLARAAQNTGIKLHEFSVLLNHDHFVSADEHANRPEFMRQFHSLVARALNTARGERDQLYSQRRYTDPVLLTPECIMEKCAYVLSNPVKHGYVRYLGDWAGVTSLRMEYGVPRVVKKPDGFFGPGMPDEIELVLTRPPELRPDLSDVELRSEVRRLAFQRERAIRGEFKAAGKSFKGMQRIRRLSRRSAPDYGPLAAGRRSAIRPKVAGGSPKMRRDFLEGIRRFVECHAVARARLRDGMLSVEFPAGTYALRRLGLRSVPP